MDNIRGVLEYIRSFFAQTLPETNRKRRAVDTIDADSWFSSPKSRRLQSVPARRDYSNMDSDAHLRARQSIRKSIGKARLNRHVDTIVLDGEEEIIPIKRGNETRFERQFKPSQFTTPGNHKVNGTNEEDDVILVKEIKSSASKKAEASKHGLVYIPPFSGLKVTGMRNGTSMRNEPSMLLNNLSEKSKNVSRPSIGSLEHSFRLDEKIKYGELLEINAGNCMLSSSAYSTPIGKLFNSFGSVNANQNRSSKMVNMCNNSPTNTRMSTRQTIKKVLDNFNNDAIVIKDSDSDSDIVFINPPSPKPDIEVEPVNSLKVVLDTFENTKRGWLDSRVKQHKDILDKRQKEVDIIKEFADKHNKINEELRLGLLNDRLNKSLQLKDVILPVQEAELEIELPPLSAAQRKAVERAFRGDPNEVLAKKFNLNITRRDLLTLAGLNWLNDEVINFYMNLIIERGKMDQWPNVYAFNTFFYTKLVTSGPDSLRRWTKKVDLFSHDLVCVPIHLGMHWCMAVVDFRDRSIRYYDSMGGNNERCLQALRKYLEAEHKDKKKAMYDTSDFILESVKDIPQQMNGSDCGMFSCTFAEFLSRKAKITFSQEDMPYLRQKMVVEILEGRLLIQ